MKYQKIFQKNMEIHLKQISFTNILGLEAVTNRNQWNIYPSYCSL